MSFGQFPQDIALLPGGAMLLLSFLLLYRRRMGAVIDALALQGAMLALAAAWRGWMQGAPQLCLVALIEAGAKAVLLPMLLRALLRKSGPPNAAEAASGIGPGLIAGIALVLLSVLLVQPIGAASQTVAREDLALALSVLLLGLLMMVTRRGAVPQLVGLASLENGLVLAAVGIPGMPLVPALSAAGLVLVGAVLAGALLWDGGRLAQGGEGG